MLQLLRVAMRPAVSAEIWWLQVADWQPKINGIVDWYVLSMPYQ
jgi:hypothetical protein